MSEFESREMCDHTGCGHPYRLEYCEREAKDIGGDGAVAIDMIEHLIYEKSMPPGEQVAPQHRGDRNVSHSFSVIEAAGEEPMWPLVETKVTISHDRNLRQHTDTYMVYVGWQLHTGEATSEEYKVLYTLDQWPHAIIGTIDEYDLRTERLDRKSALPLVPRAMTPYDIETLMDNLLQVKDMLDSGEKESASDA